MELNRSLEDIDTTLEKAKLNPSDIKSLSQIIYLGESDLRSTDYKFLQLDNHLLQCIKEGQTVRITGEDDEKAVICTDTKTYDVTNTETSNSLLLINDLQLSSNINDAETVDQERVAKKVVVMGIFCDYLEVIPSKLKVERLNVILEKSIYKGPEHEFEIKPDNLYNFEELLNVVQGSKTELENTLVKLQVITIGDKIRKLDFEYHFRVLSFMLKLIDENSWSFDQIDYNETIDSLVELVPKEILTNLLEIYCEESYINDGEQMYKYKEKEVCQFFARVILHSAGKFNFEEFLQAWAESVPEGMQTDETMLNGIAYIERNKSPNIISILTEDMLPINNLAAKLKTLFSLKEKWTVPEITPYILSETSEKLDVNALLAKYARASNVNGKKYYSSKHGK